MDLELDEEKIKNCFKITISHYIPIIIFAIGTLVYLTSNFIQTYLSTPITHFINQSQYNIPYCKLCPSQPITSNSRDLVIFFVPSSLSQFVPSVKSLYSTGFRGHSFLILDQSLQYSQEEMFYFSPYHLSVFVSSLTIKTNPYTPFLAINS